MRNVIYAPEVKKYAAKCECGWTSEAKYKTTKNARFALGGHRHNHTGVRVKAPKTTEQVFSNLTSKTTPETRNISNQAIVQNTPIPAMDLLSSFRAEYQETEKQKSLAVSLNLEYLNTETTYLVKVGMQTIAVRSFWPNMLELSEIEEIQ